jgi:nitrogen regulatory protein PII
VKLILAVVDAERADAVRADLVDLGAPGHTELPVTSGAGRTGVHAGDRVHPGGLVVLFAAVDDAVASPIFDTLVSRRDAAGDRLSRYFLLPVERQA